MRSYARRRESIVPFESDLAAMVSNAVTVQNGAEAVERQVRNLLEDEHIHRDVAWREILRLFLQCTDEQKEIFNKVLRKIPGAPEFELTPG